MKRTYGDLGRDFAAKEKRLKKAIAGEKKKGSKSPGFQRGKKENQLCSRERGTQPEAGAKKKRKLSNRRGGGKKKRQRQSGRGKE